MGKNSMRFSSGSHTCVKYVSTRVLVHSRPAVAADSSVTGLGLQAAPSLHWPIHHCCLDTRSSSGSSKSLRWEPLKLCRCSMRRRSSAPARHPNCFSISQAACCFSSFVVWWKCNLNLLPLLLKCLEEFADIEVKPIRIHLLKSIISHCYKCHVNNNLKEMRKIIRIVRIKILVPTGSDQSGASREKCWVTESQQAF